MLSNKLKCKKGSILSFIIIVPIIVWFFLYLIFGGLYFMQINNMATIVNKHLDQALVEGQFTTELKDSLYSSLQRAGYSGSPLEIEVTPSAAFDNNNNTYVKRGDNIEIRVVYKVAHPFYYINFGLSNENKFYTGTKILGMSEKW